MTAASWYRGVRWAARLLAVLLAGVGTLLLCEEGVVGSWKLHWPPASLQPQDEMLVSLVLGGALLLLLGWFWDKWGGGVDVAVAGLCVVCCVAMAHLHSMWVVTAGLVLLAAGYVAMRRSKVRRAKRIS